MFAISTQKRLEKRVNVEFEVTVDELTISDKTIVLPKPLRMKVVNLSASGVLLFSELDFELGVHFGTVLTLGNENLFIVCMSVRKEKNDTGFYYGCMLLGVSQTDQSMIRQFVFKQEIEQRKQLKREQGRMASSQ